MSLLKIYIRDTDGKPLTGANVSYTIEGGNKIDINSATADPTISRPNDKAVLVEVSYNKSTKKANIAVGQSSFEFVFELAEEKREADRVHKTPKWFPKAGVFFGGLTLLFFMVMAFAGDFVSDTPLTRFSTIVVFSLGTALSVSFLGGSAAANGMIPLPFAEDHPIQVSVTGGIATLFLAAFMADSMLPKPKEADSENVQNSRERLFTCFYFQEGASDFLRFDSAYLGAQLQHINSIISDHGAVQLQGIPDRRAGSSDEIAAEIDRRISSVEYYLVENGVPRVSVLRLGYGETRPFPIVDASSSAEIGGDLCAVIAVPSEAPRSLTNPFEFELQPEPQ